MMGVKLDQLAPQTYLRYLKEAEVMSDASV